MKIKVVKLNYFKPPYAIAQFIASKSWVRLSLWLSCGSICWSCATVAQPLDISQGTVALLTEDTSSSSVTPSPQASPSPTPTPVPSPDAIATPETLTGTVITINQQRFDVPWLQWQEGDRTHLGLRDVDVEALLNLNLLSSDNPAQQPLQGFLSPEIRTVSAFLNYPYRYLDLTPLVAALDANLQITDDTLTLNLPAVQVAQIAPITANTTTITLNRPALWSLEQNEDTATLILENTTAPAFEAASDPASDDPESTPFALTSVSNQNQKASFSFQLPPDQKLQITEAQNPPRLIVQASDDPKPTLIERAIQWTPGVLWRQQWVNVGGDRFPVFALELNPQVANLALRPIWSNPNAMSGTERLDSMANRWQAAAAINGGFFNRNTQLPLGAVRRDNRWFSGPILNRGAIAWDDEGNYDFARLYLQETLITDDRQRIPVLYLNSGYVQAGVSRYTSEWGPTYTPLIDNEIIVLVRDNQVIEQYEGGEANTNNFPIPPDGQLLTIRANSIPADWLAVGTQIQIESRTLPENFANYPHIIGAGPMLIQNNQIVLDAASEKFSQAFVDQAAPRSVIARSDRGTIWIIAIHNREGGRGPTLAEAAQIMQRLGMIDALNLDGGSSTSLYMGGQLINRPPNTAARVHNGIGLYLLQR